MEGEIYFLQYSEVVFRETKFDPIKKIKLLFLTTEFLHGLAIRESGQVDIYWNCKRVNSSEECFDDIDINFDKYFIQRRDESILTIDTKWHTRVGIEVAEETELTIEDLHESHYKRINNHVKIYQSFALINISFFVAHGNYISLYDIIEKKWKKTFHFEEKVLNVFRNEKNDTAYNIGLYLANNRVKVIDTEDPTNTDQW